jgi:hypothetical protein
MNSKNSKISNSRANVNASLAASDNFNVSNSSNVLPQDKETHVNLFTGKVMTFYF